MRPIVSILVPVKNSQKFLGEAIQSLLNQTMQDFEILVIDDGSTDGSFELALELAGADGRIKPLRNPETGISTALNFGIKHSQSRYIARMDADDISEPHRLEIQLKKIKSSSDILIVGSNIRYFGTKSGRSFYPRGSGAVRYALLYGPSLAHPTFLIDRERLNRHEDLTYADGDNAAQDYDLLVKLACLGYKFENCSQCLLRYRIHSKQVSKRRTNQSERAFEISKVYNNYQQYEFSEMALKYIHFYDSEKFSLSITYYTIVEILNHVMRGIIDRKYSSIYALLKILSIIKNLSIFSQGIKRKE